jgi:ATP-dependent DNA ligase
MDKGRIELDLVVMGVIYGEGKYSKYFATYLLGAYLNGKLHPVSRVGTGFMEQQLEELTVLFQGIIVKNKP